MVNLVIPCTVPNNESDWCYFLSPDPVTWSDASSTCSQDGGTLVVVTDINTHRYLRGILVENGKFEAWLGAREIHTGWTWLDGTLAGEQTMVLKLIV